MFYPFPEGDNILLQKIREDMVDGPSIVFTGKTVVRQTRIRSPSNTCKSVVGINASQLYCFAKCLPMPTGLYTRWEFNVDLQRFKPWSNKTRSFENMVIAFFQNSRPKCDIDTRNTTGTQWKIDSFTVDGVLKFWSFNRVSEALGCFYHFFRMSVSATLPYRWRHCEGKKEERNGLFTSILLARKTLLCHWNVGVSVEASHAREPSDKVFCQINISLQTSSELWELTFLHSEGRVVWLRTMWSKSTRKLQRETQTFPTDFQRSIRFTLRYWRPHEEIRSGKQTADSYPEKIIVQFYLKNGTIITPLLNFYLELGLGCARVYRFVQYTPVKGFTSFVQSAVDARRKGDENPHSSVVAETMKLLANGSYGYQILDRSRHTISIVSEWWKSAQSYQQQVFWKN